METKNAKKTVNRPVLRGFGSSRFMQLLFGLLKLRVDAEFVVYVDKKLCLFRDNLLKNK